MNMHNRDEHSKPRWWVAPRSALLACVLGFSTACSGPAPGGGTDVVDSEVPAADASAPSGPNAAQEQYLASLDEETFAKVTTPLTERVVYELVTKDGHRFTWEEETYGLYSVAERGRLPLRLVDSAGLGPLSAAELYSKLSPDTAVPKELLALDARAEEMESVYADLSSLRGPSREVDSIPTTEDRLDAEGTVHGEVGKQTSALSVAGLRDWCRSWLSSSNNLVEKGSVFVTNKINRSDVTRALTMAAAYSGEVGWRSGIRTWWSWSDTSVDLAADDAMGRLYNAGVLDFDVRSEVYLDPGEHGGHCVVFWD